MKNNCKNGTENMSKLEMYYRVHPKLCAGAPKRCKAYNPPIEKVSLHAGVLLAVSPGPTQTPINTQTDLRPPFRHAISILFQCLTRYNISV